MVPFMKSVSIHFLDLLRQYSLGSVWFFVPGFLELLITYRAADLKSVESVRVRPVKGSFLLILSFFF